MSPPRKPRRLGLYAPFALLLIAALAWTGFWLWARGEARARMDGAVADLKRAGYEIGWSDRTLGGYPFRLDVTLTDARVREPSGWALMAPTLEAEAFLHAPGHWMIGAPKGFTFVRPVGGPVEVTGKSIVASLRKLNERPPSFSFSGSGLAFAPQPGAQPFGLSGAGKVELHLRAGPDDEGGLFLRVDGGKARLTGLLGRIAGDRPVAIVWNSTLSKMSAFQGEDWPSAVRNWTAAGGRMTVREAGVTAGDAVLGTRDGSLGVDSTGRVSGRLEVTLRQAPQALGAMGAAGAIAPDAAAAATAVAQARQGNADVAQAAIHFQAGRTTLGPVALAPAPKVYDLR